MGLPQQAAQRKLRVLVQLLLSQGQPGVQSAQLDQQALHPTQG